MPTERKYIFIPKFTLSPNKVAYYNEVSYYGKTDKQTKKPDKIHQSKPTTKKFHNFEISQKASKALNQKITWLYQLSKARYIRTYSGKVITNFKLNFLTLTLPSTQVHSTATITNELFNQFLTEMRERVKMVNYVWRLEFQSNGNVHYHIVTDSYIDYYFARKVWNRILSKLGYVQAYQSKMNGLTLAQYHDSYGAFSGRSFLESAQTFARGKSDNFSQPPTVNVKSCTSNKSIAFYLSKYFSKADALKSGCNNLDNEENSKSLRLWFCSRSLSKLTGITDYCEASDICPKTILHLQAGLKFFYHKYATCIYFSWQKLSNYCKSVLAPLFNSYAKSSGYTPAGVIP